MRDKQHIVSSTFGGLTAVAMILMLGFYFGALHNVALAYEAGSDLEPAAIDEIYADVGEDSIWWEPAIGLTPRGKILLNFLSQADREGLRPSDYLPSTNVMTELPASEAAQPDYDRRLTLGLLRYIAEVRDGRLAARYVDPELSDIPTPTNAADLLKAGLRTSDFGAWLEALPPQTRNYQSLREYLQRYRTLAGIEWPRLNTNENLELGSTNPAIPNIRTRLMILGDYPADDDETTDTFDDALLAAVQRFQARNGLTPDGVIGPETYAALNVSPADIATKIAINLERLRQLPKNLGSRYVIVNIPGFDLRAISDGTERLRMRVIVGQKKRRTPILNDKITGIIFRPTWTVPVRVAREDLLPKIKADVNYLATLDFRVLSSWKQGAPELDPHAVDWQSILPERLPYKFTQKSGPNNALGLVRFTLTNPYDIYLHDTPNKNLFAKTDRAFSSGCVRVADVVALASFVMESSPKWTETSIQEAMNASERQVAKLPVPVPVYITYFTATVNEVGDLNLSKDIYGRDAELMRVLGLGPGD
ncbi:L,D-transpeptidase family protein [Sneathiella sp. CAU 1612]|uniref:L,D-transpeptidase family protein n=1 Tax=Sneathiella sedimenti TaxID=2816034 RepID=A0ABS3F646_9PROT|nr:L,D-transpeptidase family protein [Sneathiella sedimenti]MBO0333994.1 L,D-transpeptidase family protein [Sneathiella sedimenti]